jgi:hypothetical protein
MSVNVVPSPFSFTWELAAFLEYNIIEYDSIHGLTREG